MSRHGEDALIACFGGVSERLGDKKGDVMTVKRSWADGVDGYVSLRHQSLPILSRGVQIAIGIVLLPTSGQTVQVNT